MSSRPELKLVAHANGQTLAFPLPPRGSVTLGRAAQNPIRIDEPSISREHLKISVLDAKTIEVEDLGSANGTALLLPSALGRGSEETQARPVEKHLKPHTPLRVEAGCSLRAGLVLLFVDATRETKRPSLRPQALARPDVMVSAPILVDERMRRIYALAGRAAASDISILILGETGVGKEVLAETIHRHSPRAARPLLRLNCAALPENLLESQLFGHEKGAFTGALQTKAGLLESTNGGSVFLDEIGELPLSTQVKLLRVLEERVVMRVGSTRTRPIDVRFITATNRDLIREVERGSFRGDLFFRINGVTLRIPPLRERRSEVEPLARHFLRHFCTRSGMPVPELTPGALDTLLKYDWPGNVRELRNVMERVPLLAGSGPVLPEHILLDAFLAGDTLEPAEWGNDVTQVMDVITFDDAEQQDERERIIRALSTCGGNQTRAAKMLGISRRTLSTRLNEYNLPRPRKGK
jgi:two-component system, NtrC family, response regulator AtoC